MTMSTINDHLASLRKHVADLTARTEAAEGKLDIIKRRLEGEGDDELAIDYGGTGWESDPVVLAVAELQQENVTVEGMYFIRLRKYARLEARMGLVAMCRVQIEGPPTEEGPC